MIVYEIVCVLEIISKASSEQHYVRWANVTSKYRVPFVMSTPPCTRDPGCNKNSPCSNLTTRPVSAIRVPPPSYVSLLDRTRFAVTSQRS